MSVAYQGERGAFSESAAREAIADADVRGMPTFQHVFDAVASGEVRRAVVPFESSSAGSVPEVLDLLIRAGDRGTVAIIGEHWHRTELALLGRPGVTIEEIAEVRSHPQALAQAGGFLNERLPRAARIPVGDTAAAAREVGGLEDGSVAAIASSYAAELYGLDVLAENLESNRRNMTRFLILGPPAAQPEGADKTTLVVTPSLQAPNALFRALTTFVGRRLALHRIEPRPQAGKPGNYHYIIDVEGDARSEPLSAAVLDAEAFCERLRVVGSYTGARPA